MNVLTVTIAALTAAVTLAPAPAAAGQFLGRSGSWTIERGVSSEGNPMCNLYANANGGLLYFKHFAGDDHITMQLFKMSWRLPQGWDNRIALPVTIGVDSNTLLNKSAAGYSFKTKTQLLHLIEVIIPGEEVKDFFGEFREALKLWVKFNQGTEQPWVIDMTGSRDAEFVFKACIKTNSPSTQPYSSSSSTQPYGTQPTQPYGKGGV